jgi:hypothetical protein
MEQFWGKADQLRDTAGLRSALRGFAVAIGLFMFSISLSGCFGAISGCFSALADGDKQAQAQAAAMHDKMTRGDLAGIYDNADQRYKDAISREKSDALFTAVTNKLGAPQDCKQQGFNMNATTSGTTLRLVCQTTFSKNATGMETFVWLKSGDQYRLLLYNINSDELIER